MEVVDRYCQLYDQPHLHLVTVFNPLGKTAPAKGAKRQKLMQQSPYANHANVGDEIPLLYTMLCKVLAKGNSIEVVETHRNWAGIIQNVELVGPSKGFTINTISVFVKTGDDATFHSFTISRPDNWKLGKDTDGQWKLWPPKSSKG